MSASLKRCLLVVTLLSGLVLSPVAFGQSMPDIKMVFLVNFIKYTNWPALPAAFNICLIGEHGLESEWQTLTQKEISGRPLRIREIKMAALPGNCHLVTIAQSHKSQLKAIAALLANQPIITVTDFQNDAADEAMVALYVDEGQLRFSVNNTLAEASGLSFSSRLLRLARVVR